MTLQKRKSMINAFMTVGSGILPISGRMIDFYSILKKKNPGVIVALTAVVNHLEHKTYLEAIVKIFLTNVRAYDEAVYQRKDYETGKPYYFRWTYTDVIARELNISPEKVRRNLTKLEKAGLVISQRSPNSIRWAVKDVPGYIQYGDRPDYLVKQ
jgi:DNA-binding transcriptional ArsR family regulator